jgi:hypothetical protein
MRIRQYNIYDIFYCFELPFDEKLVLPLDKYQQLVEGSPFSIGVSMLKKTITRKAQGHEFISK